jgi:hypothetical protein
MRHGFPRRNVLSPGSHHDAELVSVPEEFLAGEYQWLQMAKSPGHRMHPAERGSVYNHSIASRSGILTEHPDAIAVKCEKRWRVRDRRQPTDLLRSKECIAEEFRAPASDRGADSILETPQVIQRRGTTNNDLSH